MCLIIDVDLYLAITEGHVAIVKDNISHFDATDIALESGGHLDVDIIITATVLKSQAFGRAAISLDGIGINLCNRFVYKAYMLENVPNLFWCVGYTNASWTLRADMTAQSAGKLMAHIGFSRLHSRLPTSSFRSHGQKPSWDIKASYVTALVACAAQVRH